jgi:hypothetical protein
MVGKIFGPEPGDNAEGEIEAADEDPRRKAHPARRNAELGDEPDASRSEPGGDGCGKEIDLRLAEAVEEEVGHGEVVRRGRSRDDIRECVGMMRLQAEADVGSRSLAACSEQTEHGGADVHGVGGNRGILREKGGEKAAVPVAEEERAAAVRELRQEVEAAPFERAAQGKVFEPAIGAGDAVKVGRRCQLSVSVIRC